MLINLFFYLLLLSSSHHHTIKLGFVYCIENFFRTDECSKVKTLVVPDATGNDASNGDSVLQVNSATFSPLAQSQRTSTTWFCHYAQMPTLLAKATHIIKKPQHHMEEPQIVQYRTGE